MKFKFLTINILHGGVFWDNLVSFIHDIDPDIMTLQEVFGSTNKNLEKRFRTMEEFKVEFPDFKFSVFNPTAIDKSTKSPWGNAVFSKCPIVGSSNYLFNGELIEYDFVEDDPDPSSVTEGMVEAEIDLNGLKIYVYSWHGVWDTHGEDSPKRFEMEKVITTSIGTKKPVILAGDTNLYPTTQFVRNISDKLNLKSVFGNSLVSTFNLDHKDKKKTGYATSAVDMVFVSPEFKIISKEMPLVDVSDHMPLVVELEV